MTYLYIHIAGAIAALALQIVLGYVTRSALQPMLEYIDALNAELVDYGLFFDANNNVLISRETNLICPIYTDFRITPLFGWGVIFQSLLLSWINFIIIGIGLISAYSIKNTNGQSFDQLRAESDKLSDRSELKSQLVQISTSRLSQFGNARERAQIQMFIDDHIDD